jgi:hypothetical protein
LIEHLMTLHIGTATNVLRSVQIEAAHERRQPSKEHSLGFGQQRVRPVHRSPQGLLAAHGSARTARQ